MTGLVAALAVLGTFSAILGGLVWLGTVLRRRGAGGRAMMPVDEIFHPAAHRYRFEIEVQQERMLPSPSADDQWPGTGTGTVPGGAGTTPAG